MKQAQKLAAGSMNGSREQILFWKAGRICMALSPQAGEGAEAFYSTLATGTAGLVILTGDTKWMAKVCASSQFPNSRGFEVSRDKGLR